MTMTTLILTHADSDGICSGALAVAASEDPTVFFTSPVSVIDDAEEAEEYDRVIICDIAINISTSGALRKRMNELAAKRELIYIDHHPLPEGFSAPWLVHDQDACGSLLTYWQFKDKLSPDMSRVAMYGAIADFRDNTPLAKELVTRWDKRSLYYHSGTLSQGIEIDRKNFDSKRDLVFRLSKNIIPSDIDGLVKKAVTASRLEEGLRTRVAQSVVRLNNLSYVVDAAGFISKAAIYARIYGNTPVGISAELRPSHHMYDLSVRAEDGIDLNRLLNDSAVKFGGHGGGHPQAGGGRIPEHRLNDFLADLDAAIGRAISEKRTTAEI
ncbi:DHHA1 domain-containing protein [Methanocella arvoryzae]|uniref:Phosphoesterase n=1 Tax=Methanocella arvoryzae (strain DSM 22066 / NBRC 105507 / MRE50) TaxID=351160 RepID=Q0W1G2_METAR|nr:DHHA1 domain-containing protein [Methanocella arvoryzae]CAJ37781.1 putative phosphoesterase [Methanocella arvoryzae MRE50]